MSRYKNCHDLTLDDDEDDHDENNDNDASREDEMKQKHSVSTSVAARGKYFDEDNDNSSNDDEDDDDSVEVITSSRSLPSKKPPPSLKASSMINPTDTNKSNNKPASQSQLSFLDTSSDDSDDELILTGGPTFSTFRSTHHHTTTTTTSTAHASSSSSSHHASKITGTWKCNYDQDDDTSCDSDSVAPSNKLNPPPPVKANTAATAKTTTSRRDQDSKEDRAEQRRLQKLQRDQQKLEEKKQQQLLRQQQRQQQKEQREQMRVTEREAKRRHVDQVKQQQGKYSAQEICVLLDPSIVTAGWKTVVSDLRNATPSSYMAQEYPPSLRLGNGAHAIQWVRQDYSTGGATAAWQSLQQQQQQHQGRASDDDATENWSFEHLDRLLLVFYKPQEFLKLLDRSEHTDDDDYPKLEAWVLGVQAAWRMACRSSNSSSSSSSTTAPKQQQPRMVVLFYQVREELDRMWKAYSKIPTRQRDTMTQPPTDAELEDAMTWMLIRFQVESIVCSHDMDLLDQVQKMTRALCERPYQRQVTELQCVKKLKSYIPDTSSSSTTAATTTTTTTVTNVYSKSSGPTPLQRAKDTWIRQLQQIPHVSETKATNLAQHYPTAQSLWHAYHDPSSSLTVEDKRQLVAGILTEGRREAKLSDTLYRIMTSRNPHEMI